MDGWMESVEESKMKKWVGLHSCKCASRKGERGEKKAKGRTDSRGEKGGFLYRILCPLLPPTWTPMPRIFLGEGPALDFRGIDVIYVRRAMLGDVPRHARGVHWNLLLTGFSKGRKLCLDPCYLNARSFLCPVYSHTMTD